MKKLLLTVAAAGVLSFSANVMAHPDHPCCVRIEKHEHGATIRQTEFADIARKAFAVKSGDLHVAELTQHHDIARFRFHAKSCDQQGMDALTAECAALLKGKEGWHMHRDKLPDEKK